MRTVVMFSFNGFAIGRALYARCANDTIESFLEPTAPYEKKKPKKQVKGRETVQGEKPVGGGEKWVINCENNEIPKMWRQMMSFGEAEDELESMKMAWDVSSGGAATPSYTELFKHLLWTEEVIRSSLHCTALHPFIAVISLL